MSVNRSNGATVQPYNVLVERAHTAEVDDRISSGKAFPYFAGGFAALGALGGAALGHGVSSRLGNAFMGALTGAFAVAAPTFVIDVYLKGFERGVNRWAGTEANPVPSRPDSTIGTYRDRNTGDKRKVELEDVRGDEAYATAEEAFAAVRSSDQDVAILRRKNMAGYDAWSVTAAPDRMTDIVPKSAGAETYLVHDHRLYKADMVEKRYVDVTEQH